MLSVHGSVTGEVEGKRTIRLNAKSREVLLAMMAIVERGRVYEITNLFYSTVICAHFFIGQETSIATRLEHNLQTDKA